MNRFLRRFRELLKIQLQPFLQLSAIPPEYPLIGRPEWATGEVPAPPETVELKALEGTRSGRIAFVIDDILGTSRARFEVFRIVETNGAPSYVAVADSGPAEVQPAVWSWQPPSAGGYRLRATKQRDDGDLSAEIAHYTVQLQLKFDAQQRTGGARLIVGSVTNQIPANVLPGLEVKYMFAVVRTDLPNQQAQFRPFFDADDAASEWDVDLEPGVYTLLASAAQFSAVHGLAAMGDQVVMDFTVS